MNYEVREALREVIGVTVKHFLMEDPYYYIAPYLSVDTIDKRCPFFEDNGITLPPQELNEEDLKTISYLAPFYRNRLAYDPKNIDRYLWATGHVLYSESSFDLLCYKGNNAWGVALNVNLGLLTRDATKVFMMNEVGA